MSSNKSLVDDDFEGTSEDIEIQPWDLPYWRGEPSKKKQPEVEEVQEVEIQPEPLTVEEIEEIRNNAYDEGFLQGLNEGREKGEAEGKQQGLEEGKQQGLQQGEEEGKRLGFDAGHAEGLAQGKYEIDTAASNLASLAQHLRNAISENDQAMPKVMAQLIKKACETVLEKELAEGDSAITEKVQNALAQLPSGEENIKVFVSAADALHLEHGLVSAGREMHFDIDDTLAAGSARIVSQHSLLEFSSAERMTLVFAHIDNVCEQLDVTSLTDDYEDSSAQQTEDIPATDSLQPPSEEEHPDAE